MFPAYVPCEFPNYGTNKSYFILLKSALCLYILYNPLFLFVQVSVHSSCAAMSYSACSPFILVPCFVLSVSLWTLFNFRFILVLISFFKYSAMWLYISVFTSSSQLWKTELTSLWNMTTQNGWHVDIFTLHHIIKNCIATLDYILI